MELASLTLLIVFTAVTVWLLRTKYERQFLLLFLIRTQWGIRLIDALAKIKPAFWKFMGDLGVLMAFSGLGAFYLSKKEESRRNLHYMMALAAVAVVLLAKVGIPAKAASAVIIATGLLIVFKRKSATLNFLFTSLLVSAAAGAFIPKVYYSLLLGFLGLPAVMLLALAQQAYNIFQGSTLPGVSPLLPSTKDGNLGVGFPGYDIFIPWWYALIALLLTLVPHEMAHGIMSRVHHIRLKSTGLLTFGALPVGAFVEPDEAKLKTKPGLSRIRMYAAGSMANFMVGILATLCLASMMLALDYIMIKDGVTIVNLDASYPAVKTLEVGMTVKGINGRPVVDVQTFKDAASTIKPGDLVAVETDRGTFNLTAAENPADKTRGYMGVNVMESIRLRYGTVDWVAGSGVLKFAFNTLGWTAFFAINIGLVNLLPMPPFDGYRTAEEVIKSAIKNREVARKVSYSLIFITATVLVLNVYPLVRMVLNPLFDYIGI
jgi:membrane-associated protease RseP (regulator of RpoE activity)